MQNAWRAVTEVIFRPFSFAGSTIFSGYFELPKLTRCAFDKEGFYKAGDLFEIAGDRLPYYRYVGRSKALVIRGGVTIVSEEIDNLLMACPGMREAAVVGVPDAELREQAKAMATSAGASTHALADKAAEGSPT